ncbi:MAG: hypothetical protein COV02_02545 [Candidatus Terrybacteria bacterium CG10_big_fil_rev_8_21_14_0_10_41_10]|uniref:Uncharacterized protein n=1 Tax=Candidatus Terrybacteria bacterium CG10_big_fil_rev_8_21_14_0_10_41_10 TaxID=1975026 RepID=A0A2M8L9Z7_9BACT|nr:MAG: hypothetical protein COV02_02545 [Candidatus Terrybacteria bacterium CG10_big_fil_rev_8_21_14_0_10_41_10]
MSKKEIFIILITAMIFALAGFGFFVFLRQNTFKVPVNVSGGEGGTTPFPSGGEDRTSVKPGGAGSGRFVDQGGQDTPVKKGQLIQLTEDSVSGAAPVSSTTLRYIERSTGNVYEVGYSGKNRKRLTNTTILKSFETFWTSKANKVLIKYFEEAGSAAGWSVKNFLADLSVLSGEPKELSGVFLPSGIKTAAVSPVEDKVFYLILADGEHQGIVANFKNENKNSIFSLNFGEFNAEWPNRDIITLITKPAAMADGYLYFLNQRTEKFERILGGVKGLTARVSTDASKIIYSASDSRNGNFNTRILDAASNSSSEFDFNTLPEKCVWGANSKTVYCAAPKSLPKADYPDEWYQGEISFNDSLWKKDFTDGATTLLHKDLGFDAINLSLSENGEYLIFMDKATGILWSLILK